MKETKLVESSTITFELEAKTLDVVGELKAIGLNDDEDEPPEEAEAAQINVDGGLGEQRPQKPKLSKRSSPDNGLRSSSRLAQWHRANTQCSRKSDDSSFDYGNFLATLLENEDEDTFNMMMGFIPRD